MPNKETGWLCGEVTEENYLNACTDNRRPYRVKPRTSRMQMRCFNACATFLYVTYQFIVLFYSIYAYRHFMCTIRGSDISGGDRFESRLGYWLSWVAFLGLDQSLGKLRDTRVPWNRSLVTCPQSLHFSMHDLSREIINKLCSVYGCETWSNQRKGHEARVGVMRNT
jgi:hypothetical protein